MVKIIVRSLCKYIILFLFSLRLIAGEPAAPIGSQIPIILKLLSFERNIKNKSGQTINITVVYQKDFRSSYNTMKEISDNEQLIKNSALEGKKFSVRYLSISSVQDFVSECKSTNIILVAPLRAIDIGALSSTCDSRGILSVSIVPDYVENGYFSVAVGLKGDRPQPVINLYKVKREGAEFSARLLDLSKVVYK